MISETATSDQYFVVFMSKKQNCLQITAVQLYCSTCDKRVFESRNTVVFDLRSDKYSIPNIMTFIFHPDIWYNFIL